MNTLGVLLITFDHAFFILIGGCFGLAWNQWASGNTPSADYSDYSFMNVSCSSATATTLFHSSGSHSQYFHWPCHALDHKVIYPFLQFGCCAWDSPSFQVARCTDGLPSHSFCQAWDNKHQQAIRCQTSNCSKQPLIAVANCVACILKRALKG